MHKILVTGASGLVGKHIVKRLAFEGHNVTGIYFNSSITTPIEKVTYKRIDLSSKYHNHQIDEDYDAIIHCAAIIPSNTNTDSSCYEKNRIIDDNMILFATKCRATRFIYLSSIYIEENKNSSYLNGKHETEVKVRQLPNFKCCFRISSPYGADQTNRNVLKIFIENVLLGKDLQYFGTGSRTQDFIHADDISNAVVSYINSKDLSEYLILNIASGLPISMKSLALLIKATYSSTGSRVRGLPNEDAQEDYRANFSIEETYRLLNWKPLIKLSDGILQWIEFKLSNENSDNF